MAPYLFEVHSSIASVVAITEGHRSLLHVDGEPQPHAHTSLADQAGQPTGTLRHHCLLFWRHDSYIALRGWRAGTAINLGFRLKCTSLPIGLLVAHAGRALRRRCVLESYFDLNWMPRSGRGVWQEDNDAHTFPRPKPRAMSLE